jgi:serine/threonine protein kinase
MEGGRLLGSGTYGCAFTPPLLCKRDSKRDYGKVGKITPDILAKQEILVANRIRKIPLSKNYFLLPEPELCELAPESKQKDPGLAECKEGFEKQDSELDLGEMRQIIEPFGGTTPFYIFHQSLIKNPTALDFVSFMRHMLEAGSTLLLAKVCHFDLHPGNLLVDKNKTVRILDFGLSFPTDTIGDTVVDGRWKRLRFGFEADAAHPSIHNSEPPELTVMNAIHNNEYTVEMGCKLTILGKPIFKDIETMLGKSREENYREMLEFWRTSTFARKRNYVQLWKTYWPGFDSWSIASILLWTLQSLLYSSSFMMSDTAKKFKIIQTVLLHMLDPNLRERFDCIEALSLFDPGNPWLNRFGQKWLESRRQQRGIQRP